MKARNLYCVSQSNCGHEYVWIFDESGLKTATTSEEWKLIKSEIETDGAFFEDIGFPISGSNSSSTHIFLVKSEKEALQWLLSDGIYSETDKPMLIEIAEYIKTVETDCDSITQDILDIRHIKAEELTKRDSRYENLIKLGLKPEDFYEKRSEEHYSDVLEELTENKKNMDNERLSILLYNAIVGLEEEGYTKEMVMDYCSMTSEEYDAVMNTDD